MGPALPIFAAPRVLSLQGHKSVSPQWPSTWVSMKLIGNPGGGNHRHSGAGDPEEPTSSVLRHKRPQMAQTTGTQDAKPEGGLNLGPPTAANSVGAQ